MVQVRSEETGIREYPTVLEAFNAAEDDKTIWKISFSLGEERVRFIRDENQLDNWRHEPLITEEIEKLMPKLKLVKP